MTTRNDSELLREGVAIIGMSGRFPGAQNLTQFWRNLREGVESISFFSDGDLRLAGVDPAIRSDPDYVGAGGALAGIDLFDAGFFGFNPREAEAMDPQQRLFLEVCWEALEHSGYDPGKYSGSVGVYAGTGFSTYFFNLYENKELLSLLGGHQVMIGNDKDHLTTHVSYKFNLRGPSVTIQTACSTSLVAVCMACRSLLDYQCDMALAGGSSIAIPQGRGYFYQEGGIASPDGHCRAFDAGARGTVAGNGAGVVLLKRLRDALADGDHICAVIRGSAVNNDGAVKVGYTAPSIDGQAEVIAMAQAVAGIDPETITYIEAHGTGTPLGDPIEIAALAQIFAETKNKNHCAIGSVKSNIGHLDTAAGVAGLIKTVLALQNKCIPASLHIKSPSPKLNLDQTPFYINKAARDWSPNGYPRRAGVSSFGIGGTNAHVVLEEAPAREVSGASRPAQILITSARSAAALDNLSASWTEHLGRHSGINLADAAFTSSVGRKEFRYRRAVVCRTVAEAMAGLESSACYEAKQREAVFLFSGQGSQYAGMAARLYRDEDAFREYVDQCLDILHRHSRLDLRPILFPAQDCVEHSEARIAQTAFTQPALFVIEYSLAKLLMDWGVTPQAMIGHSIGEYTAACISGVFSLEDALRIVALRGRLMQRMPPGAMLAVPLSESAITPWLMDGISLAAVNVPGQCVLSGPEEPIANAAAELSKQGVEGVRLRTSHAFHSSMMDPILDEFSSALRHLNLQAPAIPFISNVTGDWITSSQATDPDYWTRHLRETVRFADGLDCLLSRPDAILLEIGPSRTLTGLARQHPRYAPSTPLVNALRDSKEDREDFDYLLNAVGRLWSEGVSFDWKSFYSHERRQRLPVPTYPFERKRYWIDPIDRKAHVPAGARISGKLPAPADWLYLPSWKRVEREYSDERIASKKWLVFSEGDLGDAVVERIRELGGTVASARIGHEWDQSAYDLVVAGSSPDIVVHCWLVDGRSRSFDEWQEAGFHSILRLVRALAGRRATINVVSRGLHSVTGSERLQSAKSTVLGPCRVVPQEQPGIRCRNIDVDSSVSASSVDAILNEVMTPASEPVVAYRHGRRWVQCFEPANFQQQSTGNSLLRPRGVYLITGGFGNVGVTLAETLARNFQARLALVGREAPPLEATWSPSPPKTTGIRAVQELRELGADVLPIRADAADPAQMEAAIEKVFRQFGQLHGVIHAAGAMNADAFRSAGATDAKVAELHFRNKAKSAMVLRDILAKHSLDFCMMTSSMASVLGGLEFSAYAAANIFLDSLADEQNQNADLPHWISVNWDGWRFDEAKSAAHEFFLTPTEGAAVFRTILSRPNPRQVIVSTGDLEGRLDRWVRFRSPDFPSEPQTPELTAVHPRPEVRTTYAAPRNSVEQMIADVWQLVLGVNSIGIDDNFFELGGHSLLAIQMVSRLRDLFQVEIALTAIFEHSTIAQLAEHVQSISGNAEAQMEQLAKMLDYVEQLSPEEVEALLAKEANL